MRTHLLSALIALALAAPLAAIDSGLTYQGTLEDAGAPASGAYDLEFKLQDTAGTQVGNTLTFDNVPVTGGVFTVALDFGNAAFTGPDRFLVIAVRPGASGGTYTALAPRTRVSPAPYAQLANDANFAASVANDAIGSAQIANASILSADIADGSVASVDVADGSIGTTDIDSAQVQRRVMSTCAAGQAIRTVAADGSVTCESASAGAPGPTGPQGPPGVQGPMGPQGNPGATGPMGSPGSAGATGPAGPPGTTGAAGPAGPQGATGNAGAQGPAGAPGAQGNAGPAGATGPQGPQGPAGSADAWSRIGNAGTDAAVNFVGTTNNVALTLRVNNQRVAQFQPAGGLPNIVLGSSFNQVVSPASSSVIGGGGGLSSASGNRVSDNGGVVAGGVANTAGNLDAIATNRQYATVGGGESNVASGDHSTIAGGELHAASGDSATVSGGTTNVASGDGATVAGGDSNQAIGLRSTVAGGFTNIARGFYATVAGGQNNTAPGSQSGVGGGHSNCAGGDNSWAGGFQASVRSGNQVGESCEFTQNSGDANGDEGTFIWNSRGSFESSGPYQFLVNADGGVALNTNVVGEFDDLVIAARKVSGDADSDLVWRTRADKSGRLYLVESDGSFYWSQSNLTGVDFLRFDNGARLTAGGVFTNASSRTLKQGFTAIDAGAVLDKLIDLPISTWTYKASGAEGLHLGPMAEDFKTAFGLAGDGKSIGTVDADGVALAAIQGLNAKLDEQNAELHAQVATLMAEVAALRKAIAGPAGAK